MTNDTLKEYYVKLNEAWNNALNVLTAINQSLSSNSNQIQVEIANETYNIPSFLHIENRLDTLSNNFDALFDLPESGEAWLTNNEQLNSFKINLVRTGTSPVSPKVRFETIRASLTDNNFLKDLVSPKTFLRLEIENLPENIEKILVKKIIFNDLTFYDAMFNRNPQSYEELNMSLYTLRKGVDFEEYDSILELPVKRDRYKSAFKIVAINDEKTRVVEINGNNRYEYRITVDTLKYTDQEDPSIEFKIKPKDKICLGDTSTIFEVIEVFSSTNELTVRESFGHYVLQNVDENPMMIFGIYNNDFSDYHYVEVPLEENAYICLMLGTLQNNVRSMMSVPLFINLNDVYMTDANAQFFYDEYGNKMTYMQYYEKNCTNIGDLILGLTKAAYPQLTSISAYALENLQEDSVIKSKVSETINAETILEVLPINEHIINNETAESIISMHAQKNELSTKINNINDSISSLNEKLTTTDFTQDVSLSQVSLKRDLDNQYAEKIILQKQLIALVEDINVSSAAIDGKELKYRIRGITETKDLEDYLHSSVSEGLDIIGIDVEYKYKSINKTTTKIVSINNNVFSDWNKYETIDKERIINIGQNGGFSISFENYSGISNIIKWNQIDIPIVADEDVVIRIRYKYNIGQPFINVYTPWSEEITVVFPVEYKEDINVNTIISENQRDVITATFNKTLINDGYTEHLNDGILDGTRKFYHNADNIYSGFSTPENRLMSIKDKMNEMIADIEKYQSLIESELTQKYKVYIQYDDKSIELLPNVDNTISIFNSEHIMESFVKKDVFIVIKNVGEVPIKLYSQFPGGINTPLLMCTDEFYEKNIVNYERVPLIVDGSPHYQTLGQWIYFRQNNPWTGRNIYYVSETQNRYDWLASNINGCVWNSIDTQQLMKKDYNQVLFGYRKRETGADTYFVGTTWKGLLFDEETNTFTLREDIESSLDITSITQRYQNISEEAKDTFFMYQNKDNNYLIRYEDIYYEEEGVPYYLDAESNINEFISHHSIGGNFKNDTDFTGAFLYPNLDAMSSILTDGTVGSGEEIPAGGMVSVPLSLEFFLNEELTNVVKGLNFDIKPSSFNEPVHYIVNINCQYDFTASGNVLGNSSLIDESIDY